MEWTSVPWGVVWLHLLIFLVTLTLGFLLQAIDHHRERRRAVRRWYRQQYATGPGHSQMATRDTPQPIGAHQPGQQHGGCRPVRPISPAMRNMLRSVPIQQVPVPIQQVPVQQNSIGGG